MTPSTDTLDALCKGSAIEIETLQKMKEGSTILFDGLIAESQKRNMTLEELKGVASTTAKASFEKISIAGGAIRALLQQIHDEIETCQSDAVTSHTRYVTAIQDTKTQYERNAANEDLLKASGTVIKQSFDILDEVFRSLDGASITFNQKWRSAIMAKINAVSSGREHLERAYSDIHGERIETEIRDAAITQAKARYKKEKAGLEARLQTLDRVQMMLWSQNEDLMK